MYQIPIFLSMASVFFMFMYFSSISDCRKNRKVLLERNKEIKRWPFTDAVIRRVAYGVDYQFHFFDDHLNFDNDIKKSDFEYLHDDYDDLDLALAHENNGVLIEYEFVVDGEKMISRSISPIFEQSNIKILWKVKPGDTVRVYVNPKNKSECYLKNSSKDAINRIAREAEWESGKYILYSLACLFLTVVYFV